MSEQSDNAERLAAACILSIVGGFLDIYTYLWRGGVFANAVTGNMVLFGLSVAGLQGVSCAKYLLPISFYAAGVLAAICSNLARGCEKQYLAEESALFGELASYFTACAATDPADASAPTLDQIADHFQRDLDTGYPTLRSAAESAADRGTLRICTWGEKVTRALASLAERYRREGPAMLDGARIWVCSVCGFTFVGERPPTLCPVCKVPDWKFDEIRGRAA